MADGTDIGTYREDQGAQHEHLLAPVKVAQTAAGDHQCRDGEGIGGDYPLYLLDGGVELADDSSQGYVEQGNVDEDYHQGQGEDE